MRAALVTAGAGAALVALALVVWSAGRRSYPPRVVPVYVIPRPALRVVQ